MFFCEKRSNETKAPPGGGGGGRSKGNWGWGKLKPKDSIFWVRGKEGRVGLSWLFLNAGREVGGQGRGSPCQGGFCEVGCTWELLPFKTSAFLYQRMVEKQNLSQTFGARTELLGLFFFCWWIYRGGGDWIRPKRIFIIILYKENEKRGEKKEKKPPLGFPPQSSSS